MIDFVNIVLDLKKKKMKDRLIPLLTNRYGILPMHIVAVKET